MRNTMLLVVFILLLFLGDLLYRMFLRPIDPVQPAVQHLAEYFKSSGIPVQVSATRHGFRHRYVTASASMQMADFPLPISIDLCPSEVIAEQHLQDIRKSPNLSHSLRRGQLVMYLPMWPDDEPLAKKVKEIFLAFQPEM